MPLCLSMTKRFSVLEIERKNVSLLDLPFMKLADLLLHRRRNATDRVRRRLWQCLVNNGFVVLTLSRDSEPARVVNEMRESLYQNFFPPATTSTTTRHKPKKNAANLQSGEVYRSERGVPMWRLGYELCDEIREVIFVLFESCASLLDLP